MDVNKRLFSKDHMWVLEKEGNTVRVGISDYAQKQLNTIIFLNLPDAGETVSAGGRLGDVESLKSVIDLLSPVSGTVLAVNTNLLDDPGSINSSPYDSWLVEMEADSIPQDLMDDAGYREYLDRLWFMD